MSVPVALLFDMDDTILNDTGDAERCWELACECYAPELGMITLQELYRAIDEYRRWYWNDAERHRTGRLKLNQARRDIVIAAVERLGFTAPDIACQIADLYTEQRDQMIAPFPGALDTLQQLCGQGIRLALITNGNAELQRHKIVRFGLQPYFDYILIEGEFGAGKPDTRVYQHVLEQLKVKPNEAWMIGDNLEWDVAAPQKLGIYGVWNDVAGKGLPESSMVRPDRIIRAITELIYSENH